MHSTSVCMNRTDRVGAMLIYSKPIFSWYEIVIAFHCGSSLSAVFLQAQWGLSNQWSECMSPLRGNDRRHRMFQS